MSYYSGSMSFPSEGCLTPLITEQRSDLNLEMGIWRNINNRCEARVCFSHHLIAGMMNDHSQNFLPSVNAAAPEIVGYWLVNRELIVHLFHLGRRIMSEQLWVCPHFRPFSSLLWTNEAKASINWWKIKTGRFLCFFPRLYSARHPSVSRGVPRPSSRCQMSVIPGRRSLSRWAACKPNPNTLSCSQPFQMAGGRRGELENHAASRCPPRPG